MLTDKQVLKLSKLYLETGKIEMSSIKSGTNRKTGSKYIRSGKLPSELKKQHIWRTRKDPFAKVNSEIEAMFKLNPELEAKTVFEYLQDKYPGQFEDGQLRSLQRRFSWLRIEFGSLKEVYFEQTHSPGRTIQLDWTFMNSLNITVNGEHFKHKLCHCALTYSNWEWAEICLSESFLSLKKGFQSAVKELGMVPRVLQTDNSSSATHRILGEQTRPFNKSYVDFCEHFNIEPSTINVGRPNENGDIESLNGHLKRKIEQYLLLRGYRDFNSQEEYSSFLKSILRKLNGNRKKKLDEELQFMQKLPSIFLPEYEEETSVVTKQSTARFKKVTYSLPSQYIGLEIKAHIFEDKINVLYKSLNIQTLPRIHSDRGAHINYQHVIKNLIRKPGAFENYRYKDFMFPNNKFRDLYSSLERRFGNRRRDREYLEILLLASKEGEKRIIGIIDKLTESSESVTSDKVKEKLDITFTIPFQKTLKPDLSVYESEKFRIG